MHEAGPPSDPWGCFDNSVPIAAQTRDLTGVGSATKSSPRPDPLPSRLMLPVNK